MNVALLVARLCAFKVFSTFSSSIDYSRPCVLCVIDVSETFVDVQQIIHLVQALEPQTPASLCPVFRRLGKRKALVPRCVSHKRLCAPRSLSPPLRQGIEAQPAVPLMQRTFTMQRSMPNPPTDPLCPDWIGQALQEAMPPLEPALSSSSSSPSSSFYPSPGSGGSFPSAGGFAFGGVPAFDGAFANGGEMAHGARGNGRPPVSGGGPGASQGGGAKPSGSSCILSRKWGKR